MDNSQGMGQVAHTEIQYGDRRRTDRAEVSLPVRVRPSDPREGSFDEVVTTLNASRDGLFFSTESQAYKSGMLLHVTFPYSSAPGARNVNFLGQVVRIEQLPDGRRGVAVHLLTTVLLGDREPVDTSADSPVSLVAEPSDSTECRLNAKSA